MREAAARTSSSIFSVPSETSRLSWKQMFASAWKGWKPTGRGMTGEDSPPCSIAVAAPTAKTRA